MIEEELKLNVLPQPLAERLYFLQESMRPDQHVDKLSVLEDIFKIHLKICTSAIISDFIRRSDVLPKGDLHAKALEQISGMQRPSLGTWLNALRQLAAYYKEFPEDSKSIPEQISGYYHRDLEGKRSGPAFQALEELAALIEEKPPKPTIGSALEFVVRFRNKTSGHGPTLKPVIAEKAAEQLEILLKAVIHQTQLYKEWCLVYIDRVEKRRGKTIYSAKLFQGRSSRWQEFMDSDLEQDHCIDGEVYLVSTAYDDNEHIVLDKVCSLHPFVINALCPQTKTESLFFFNVKLGRNREYVCYAFSSKFQPRDIEEDFRAIDGVVSGDLLASEIFGSQATYYQRIPTPEERRRATWLANKALLEFQEGELDAAKHITRESLKADQYCGKALLVQGLISLYESRLSEAYERLGRAVNYTPTDPAARYARFLTSLVAGEEPNDWRTDLENLLRVDSRDSYADWVRLDRATLRKNLGFSEADDLENGLAIVRLVEKKLNEQNVKVVSWLYRLPPWKQIYLFSETGKHRITPIWSSFAIALFVFIFPIITNTPLVVATGYASPESTALYFRHGTIAFIVFLGLYYPFLISKLFERMYSSLSRIVSLPPESFREWFISEISRSWGAGSSSRSLRNQTRFSELLRKDRHHFLPYVTVLIIFSPIQYLCAGDYNLLSPAPSQLQNSLSQTIPNLDISTFTAVWQSLGRYFSYFLELYVVAYAPVILVPFMIFFPRLVNLPVRYFPGVESSLTLKVVSAAFLKIGLLGVVFSIGVLAQLLAFSSMDSFAFAAYWYVCSILIIFTAIMCIPPLTVSTLMIRQRAKILEELCLSYEGKLNVTKAEKPANFDKSLAEFRTIRRNLKKLCPVFPMRFTDICVFILASVTLYASVIGYLYAVFVLEWPAF
jgi:hypothetical protein